jgi:hypothetical protein
MTSYNSQRRGMARTSQFTSQFFPCNCYVCSSSVFWVLSVCKCIHCPRVSTQLQLNDDDDDNNIRQVQLRMQILAATRYSNIRHLIPHWDSDLWTDKGRINDRNVLSYAILTSHTADIDQIRQTLVYQKLTRCYMFRPVLSHPQTIQKKLYNTNEN